MKKIHEKDITLDENNNIISLEGERIINTKGNNYIYSQEDLSYTKKKGKVYLFDKQFPDKLIPLEFFSIIEPSDIADLQIILEKNFEDEKFIIDLERYKFQNLSIPNLYLVQYLKYKYKGVIATKYKNRINQFLKEIERRPHKSLSHRKTMELFECIGTSEAEFFETIENVKLLKYKNY